MNDESTIMATSHQVEGLVCYSGFIDFIRQSGDIPPMNNEDNDDGENQQRDQLLLKSMQINYVYIRMLAANRLPLDTPTTMRLIVDTLQLLCERCLSMSETKTTTKMLIELSALVSNQSALALLLSAVCADPRFADTSSIASLRAIRPSNK